MTFPRVSRRGRHFANVGDVIIYPDLVVARTVNKCEFREKFWNSSELRNCALCLSSLQQSRDVTTDIYIFNVLNSYSYYLFVLFLSILFILYIYLFISYFPTSAVRYPLSAIRHPLSVSSFYRLLTWGAFQTQDLAVAGPWPDRSFWPERNRLFQRVLLKNRIFRAPYLGSEWSSWIVLVKSEILTYDEKELAAHFWQIEGALHHFKSVTI